MTHKRGELDSYVDTVLIHFQSGAECLIYDGIDKVGQLSQEKTERNIFRDLLLGEGLLKIERENTNDRLNPYCRITVKGYSVIYNDGWLKYKEREDAVKQLNEDLLRASLTANQSSVNANNSLIETNDSLRQTNRSIRKSNIIIPIILVVTFLATCVQVAITWYTSEARTYKLKTEQLEEALLEKDIQLKKLETQIRDLQLKLDSISQKK
jgi:hypothetical protein